MDASQPIAALLLGLALGSAPGPVQVILLAEGTRHGFRRGLGVMAGANAAFGVTLLILALGISGFAMPPAWLRAVRVVGGTYLLWLAWDGWRGRRGPVVVSDAAPVRHPAVRGATAVALNPPLYVFLASTGAAVLGDAAAAGGRTGAIVTAGALLIGVSVMDGLTLLLGVMSRRLPDAVTQVILAVASMWLAALGGGLIWSGLRGP